MYMYNLTACACVNTHIYENDDYVSVNVLPDRVREYRQRSQTKLRRKSRRCLPIEVSSCHAPAEKK